MTCGDAAQLLDAFVDAELPGHDLVEVARHVAACGACDVTVRELESLRAVLGGAVRAEAATLDLSRVWPAVTARMDRVEARRAWRRRLRSAPAWGAAALAMAAGALLWLRTGTPEAPRVATRPRPNHTVIERIDSDGSRFELRRERKNGTTLIMVSAADPEVLR